MTTKDNKAQTNADKTGWGPGMKSPKTTGVLVVSSGGGAGGVTKLVFRYFVKQFMVATLLFLAIFAVVMVALEVAFSSFSLLEEGESLAYLYLLPNASSIFLLVMGIIMPLYLELLMSYGITRRQLALGLLGASALVSCALALVSVVVAAVLGDLTVLFAGQALVTNWFYFLTGWLIVIGYQYRRVFAAIATTLAGITLPSLWFAGNPIFSSALQWQVDTPINFGFIVLGIVICLVLAAVLIFLSRRIPLKV